MRTLKAFPIHVGKAELGECPVWDEQQRVLWWIDWMGGFVYRTDVAIWASTVFRVKGSLAAVALSSTERIVLAIGHGFAELDPEDGRVRELARAEPDDVESRMCDGKCDARGRFWAGTTSLDERSPIGALFVMETDGRVRRVLENAVVSNGLCWSLDDSLFYYVDTATRRIDVFDFDLAQGTIANRRAFVEFAPGGGDPDGLAIDSEGYLWVALWDGWQVRRYSPAGDLDTVIEVPVARPTCCAFGGADLRDLFITTAMPDSAEDRADQTTAGMVFHVRVDAPGRSANRCAYRPE